MEDVFLKIFGSNDFKKSENMRRIHFIAYIFFRRHTYKDLNSKAETSWLQKLRYYNQNSSKTRVSKKMLQN